MALNMWRWTRLEQLRLLVVVLLWMLVPRTFAVTQGPESEAGSDLPRSLLQPLLERYEQSKETLGNRRYIALVNYRQPSWKPRFHVIDPESLQVVASYRVAHGKGSDPDHDGFVESLGDMQGSYMSSSGFFRTGEAYLSGQDGHGLSLRLEGLSKTNRNAYERNIVIHANHYMERDFINSYGLPGRSHGCLVFSSADRDDVISKLRDGALIYAVR